MESKADPIVELLDKYFEHQGVAASGKEPSKWFLSADMEQQIKQALTDVDNEVYEAYIKAGEDGELKSPDFHVTKRIELLFLNGILSGLRKRYAAGEESTPLTELDTRRYSMYSSTNRRNMLDRLRTSFNDVEE